MYPYATTTYQEEILQEIQTTNTNIEELTTSMKQATLTIAVLITIILIRNLILKCLGSNT